MNGFLNIRFPEDISNGASGGPEYCTQIIQTKSGYEQRLVNWLESRLKYNVAHGIKTKEQMQRLLSFYHNVKGRAYGFLYKDWTDYQGNREKLEKISKNEFQLCKTYEFASNKILRKIYKPVVGTVEISGLANSDYKICYETGIVSCEKEFDDLHASFEFDVAVRFDSDFLDINNLSGEIYSLSNISLVEIKL